MFLARQTAKRALSLFVLLTAVQLSAKAAWIEILQEPPSNVIAGEVLPPSAQPLVALWNHRRAFDIFGREIPAQIVYDSEIPGVLVNANLLSMNSSESHDLFGSSLLMTRCGKAQFTNLMIPKVGVYKLLFSATYFSNNETTNATKAFEVSKCCPALPSSSRPQSLSSCSSTTLIPLSAGGTRPSAPPCACAGAAGVLDEPTLPGAAHN